MWGGKQLSQGEGSSGRKARKRLEPAQLWEREHKFLGLGCLVRVGGRRTAGSLSRKWCWERLILLSLPP